jgi:hypothetical protein
MSYNTICCRVGHRVPPGAGLREGIFARACELARITGEEARGDSQEGEVARRRECVAVFLRDCGWSVAEVAGALGKTEGWVRVAEAKANRVARRRRCK